MAEDIGKLVRAVQNDVLAGDGYPNPDKVRKVLGWSQAVLDEAWGRYARVMTQGGGLAHLGDTGLEGIGSDLKRAGTLFDWYADQMEELHTDDADEDQRKLLWERVSGPLVAGQCYGAPSCSQAIIDSQGAPFAIAPRFIEPFKLQNAMDVHEQAGRENMELLLADLKAGATDLAKKAGTGLGAIVALVGGIYLAGKVLDD